MFVSKRIICFLLILALLLGGAYYYLTRETKPELVYEEKEGYYSYTNLSYGEHIRHCLDLVIPKGIDSTVGVILYIHGGGWIGGDKEVYVGNLQADAERGYVSASINYRYADGKKVLNNDIMDDIEAALSVIKSTCAEKGVTVDRVMLAGGSAGGHLSLMYAYSRASESPLLPVAVASYAGPANLYDDAFYTTQYVEDIKKMISMISGADLQNDTVDEWKAVLMEASPISYINSSTVPTIICHGVKDDVVPYSNAVELYGALCDAGVECELITYENSGHGLEADSDKGDYANEKFYEFADRFLR